jgi:hypothetical protein
MIGVTALRRLARMDPSELRFRAAVETRKVAERLRHGVVPPRWRRAGLASVVDVDAVDGLRAAALARDFVTANDALAAHFASRASCWPVRAAERIRLRAAIVEHFQKALFEADVAAKRILHGRYDLLGYRELHFGCPPDWHLDPVHGRRAPARYWSSIPYLDPACGDHKITWELNRHQHWLVLGRAYWLTGDQQYRAACVAQLRGWLDANPPLHGINWASMLELAFRAISWMYAIEFFAPTGGDDEPWLVDMLIALDRQLSHIEHNLSRYFSPNTHLTGEALALYAVSRALPELRASARRADVGRRILLDEATRQIHSDGGHAELSAHYHRYSTDFYLLATLVARRSGDLVAPRFEAAARKQAEYLRTIADDRGTLPLIGDDDGGQLFAFGLTRPADAVPSLAAAADVLDETSLAPSGGASEGTFWILGREPRISIRLSPRDRWPSRWLQDSGYFVSRMGDAHLVFDAGAHGFLNGGHAHADALQVTLSVGGHPVLVDPGTKTYTMDPVARDRFRSARMHNTPIVDGREPARMCGPFHWESVADARFTAIQTGERFDFAQGTHDAYAPLRVVRSVAALDGFGWVIVDQVLGTAEHEIETWWHIHPDLAGQLDGGGHRCIRLDGGATSVRLAWSGGESLILTDHPLAAYAPEYGCARPAPTIRRCRRAAAPFALATFIASAAEDLWIDEADVETRPPEGFDGRAFYVSIGADRLTLLVAARFDGQAEPWPAGAVWGTADATIDAQFAAVLVRGTTTTTIAKTGSMVSAPDANERPSMASTVHG